VLRCDYFMIIVYSDRQ